MLGIALLYSGASAQFGRCCGGQEIFRECNLGECNHAVCQDCEWNDWSDWGPANCEGLCERHRTVKQPNHNCGSPCQGATVETKRCTPSCYVVPKNCVFDEWKDWSKCDSKCGGGQQFRERAIAQNSAHHGFPCDGVTKETRSCGGGECFEPQDCIASEWAEWGECSASCDTGHEQRRRTITQHSSHGGKPCDTNLAEVRGCHVADCMAQKSCVWGEWGQWGACSQSCGGGDRSRSRLIKQAPRHGGSLCDPKDMSEVGLCHMEPCSMVRDCSFDPWSSWDACSCTCNGIQHRVRHIGVNSEEGGQPCSGALREVRHCNIGDTCEPQNVADPVDCEFEEWGAWQSCSSSCGTGQRLRNRGYLVHERHGGKPCTGITKMVAECEGLPECKMPQVKVSEPVDCIWSEWDDWGACSASCNGGEQVRQRQVQRMPNAAGQSCESQPSMEVTKCNMHACGCTDCRWGPWGEWGACTCTGLRERHRSMLVQDHSCGLTCEGPKVESTRCHPECAEHAKDCVFNEWSSWTSCTATCDGGETSRERSLKHIATGNGIACEGDLEQIRPCNQNACDHMSDCELSPWSAWTVCSASCGGGQSTRAREIVHDESAGGRTCTAVLKELRVCGDANCGDGKDCVWGQWSPYSACTAPCGGGTKTRDRYIKVAPRRGGKLCEPLAKSELAECNTQSCETACVDAMWSQWESWSMCSVSCGSGWSHRTRNTAQTANHCGKGLDGLKQDFKECNMPCNNVAKDCVLSEWSDFGDCSCSCSGVRDRSRRIQSFASNGGASCVGPLKEVEACNVGKCGTVRVDCDLGEWTPWGECSAPCAGGQQTRSRQILVEPKNEGEMCDPPLKHIRGCNEHPCTRSVDCVWRDWEPWGACSKECGAGEKFRYRRIKILPQHQGKPCDPSETLEVATCNDVGCSAGDYYCGFGEWGHWSGCSTTCGPGEQIRRRELQIAGKRRTLDDVVATGHLNEILAVTFDDLTHAQMLGVFLAGVLFSTMVFLQLTRFQNRGTRPTSEAETMLLEETE